MNQKTYFAKVDLSAQKPKDGHCQPFWGPLAAILDFAGDAVLQVVSEFPGAANLKKIKVNNHC